MGKRKSRSRNASPERGMKKEKSKDGVDSSESKAAEVIVCVEPTVKKRFSAFSRYAKEKSQSEPEDNTSQTQAQKSKKRSRSCSVSPPLKEKQKKGKRAREREEFEKKTLANDAEDDTGQAKDGQEEVIDISEASDKGEDLVEIIADNFQSVKKDREKKERYETENDGSQKKDENKWTDSYTRDGNDNHARTKERDGYDDGRNKSKGFAERRQHEWQRHWGRDESRDRPRSNRWDTDYPKRKRDDYNDYKKHHSPGDEKAPQFRTFTSGAKVVVVVEHPETVCLWGCASVQSLQNNVNVAGYILQQGGRAADIYSPNSTSLVSISTLLPAKSPDTDIENRLNDISGLDEGTIREILSSVNSQSTVLVFQETVQKQRLDFLSTVPLYQHIFWSKDHEDPKRFRQLGDLPIAVALYPNAKRVRISQEMRKVGEQFCGSIQKGEVPVIAVCGGKNVGKSTMGRFLCNSALNKCKTVAYLECDVGQTEYSPPGCVSLHLITEPVFGPPFTHQRKAHKMIYFGAVTPSGNPHYYLSCVKSAFSAYTELESKCPLIVNTMGWNEGLGLIFLASTMSLVQPHYVVQFESNNRNRNLPHVTPQFVMEQERWPTLTDTSEEATVTHDLLMIKSMVDGGAKDKMSPADHRNLNLLGYLSRLQCGTGPCQPLHSLTPQSLPWGQVAVHVSHAAVPNTQIMYALNSSIVALCCVPQEMISSTDDDSLPKFLTGNPVCECLGFGIIRAIDPEKKVFMIITDVNLDEEIEFNCLIRGSLDIPQALISKQGSSSKVPDNLNTLAYSISQGVWPDPSLTEEVRAVIDSIPSLVWETKFPILENPKMYTVLQLSKGVGIYKGVVALASITNNSRSLRWVYNKS